MPNTINVGKEFYHRLAHRNEKQGDGLHTAKEFRERYLKMIDSKEFWKEPSEAIVLDFSSVTKIGPSFANEAFAYFTQFADPERILRAIKFVNVSEVQMAIIKAELEQGYRGGK